jgi:hypothetical protein
MSDLRTRLLAACTIQSGGVTGVTGVTDQPVTSENSHSYASYAGYASKAQELRKPGSAAGGGVTGGEGQPWSACDWQAYFEERAGIREYDGGLPRTEAEHLALEDSVTHWLCLHPAPASDPRHGCVHCGAGDQPSKTLLPVLAPGGHVWVHDRCWEPWQRARRHDAQEALRRLGLSLPMAQLSCRSHAGGCRAS